MKQRKLAWRIYLYFLISALFAISAVLTNTVYSMRQYHKNEVMKDLEIRARIVAEDVARLQLESERSKADDICKNIGRTSMTRITVILPDGKVIGDSDRDPSMMPNHGDREEVRKALGGATGYSIRYSETIHSALMYIALPIKKDGMLVAVIRASLPLTMVDWSINVAIRHILAGSIIVALLFALITFHLSKSVSRPLENIREVAYRLALGDLAARVVLPEDEETASLAKAINKMADQLSIRINTISKQNNEMEAVLSGMTDGVLTVDRNEHIMRINAAAGIMLGVSVDASRGRSMQEVIRNSDLLKFASDSLKATGIVETEVTLYLEQDRYLQLHGTALKDHAGANIGALIVINDITSIRKLEQVRRDFVANASHELKTPVTALKGCIETLEESANLHKDDIARFVSMMARHTIRLQSIIEDLLSLSEIEHDTSKGRILREQADLAVIVAKVADYHENQAAKKAIKIIYIQPARPVLADVNVALMEQAIGNLVDNAIKYGTEGKSIRLSIRRGNTHVSIDVADEWPGIEKKHLPRIFERFYRIDQARSRAMGGTGLGLSIVRHIALAHNGDVSVTSVYGQGSTFTITLPLPK